jgi:hypothetical protein
MQNLFLAAVLFILPALSFANPVKDFSARYEVYKNGFYLGNTTRTLTSKDSMLNFSAVTESAGFAALFFDIKINETSKLVSKNNSLNIFSYKYDEKKNDERITYQLYIDDSNKLFNSFTKKQYPLTPGLHDALGFSIAMMRDLNKGLRELKYTIAEKEKLKNYHLKFIKEEKLPSGNGSLKTIKIEHTNPKTKTRFTFWCAESMGFLPVRIVKVKANGDEVLLNMTEYNHKPLQLELNNEEFDG